MSNSSLRFCRQPVKFTLVAMVLDEFPFTDISINFSERTSSLIFILLALRHSF
jgi:hypothetical protein